MRNKAQFFKALGDETRLKILWLLMEQEELCVSAIDGILLTTQSKVSRHLRYLANAGLVTGRREGFCVYYRISVAPGSREHKLLQLLREMLTSLPATQALRQQLHRWFPMTSCQTHRPEGEEAGLKS
jgi:ArsR family transcriptional regulator